jgi:DNA end-binding protein Ku
VAARAIFKATIVIDKVKLPVKLYSAARDRRVHFRLLHEEDGVPVAQEMVHAETEETIERDEVQKAYEVEPGRFVVLEADELAELAPEADRSMEVEAFVARAALPAAKLDRPYWLGPDGQETGYFAFARALAAGNTAAIVRWTMRKRRYVGAIFAEGEHLMVITMRDAAVAEIPEVTIPKKDLDDKQLALAEQLIDTLRAPFDPDEFHDTYREKVEELVAQKAAGKKVKRLRPGRAKATDDLSKALKKSLQQAKEKRVA